MKTASVLFLLAVLSCLQADSPTGSNNDCKRMNFTPFPKSVQCGQENVTLSDPCRLLYHVKAEQEPNTHLGELVAYQMKKTFNCHIPNIVISPKLTVQAIGFVHTVEVQVAKPELVSVFTTAEEKYNLQVEAKKSIIQAYTYVGFVRGLETFMQSINCPRGKYKECTFARLPLNIVDEPAFAHRGVMVDTSRHYLPIHLLYETIDALMYNKLNVMHWHIVDQDSFPLVLDSHPQIAKYAAFSEEEIYTTQQAKDLVEYAKKRGVRIIPQLDTPGHASSWGLAPQNKGIACTFATGFMGPLDVTLDKTYQLVKEVFAEIFDIFPDPYVHLGGDEVVLTCLVNKTEFVQKEGIQEREIERHYRRKQHKILKELNPNKKFIYWINNNDFGVEKDDVVHWWGGGMPPTTNPVILSQYGPFYIDMGVGNYLGVTYGSYATWLDLYNQDLGVMTRSYKNKDNVLGAELTLWSELNNQYTHHMKIWIRGSAFAERTWNTQQFTPKPDTLGRITAHQQLMNRRGIPTAPATSQQCQTFPEYC